jgi:hypothetical protein
MSRRLTAVAAGPLTAASIATAPAAAAVFTPHLLTATGPDNLWGPAPVDSSQIAYGAGARVLAALAVATATHSAGLRQLAGIAACWFFGQNPAGIATYNPATGDGINANGTVNLKDANGASRSARTRPSPCQGRPADSRSCCARSRPAGWPWYGRGKEGQWRRLR